MKKIILLFTILTLMLEGCTKKDIPIFQTDDAGIYFYRLASYIYGTTIENYADSTTLSFSGSADVTSANPITRVRTMGKTRNYDRPVKVRADKEKSTAIEGYHYEWMPDTLAIKAGESEAIVMVRFNRTPDLLDEAVRLVLRLEENEHFKCYLETYKNTNSYSATGSQISGVEFKFVVTETYTAPSYWLNYGVDYFGPWTPQKYVVVNSVLGWTPSDWNNGGFTGTKVQLGRFDYSAIVVRDYLQAQADAGNPVRESDNSLMQLAEKYQVDYSAYE